MSDYLGAHTARYRTILWITHTELLRPMLGADMVTPVFGGVLVLINP
ncbi:MAG: hypothetical protein ACKOJ7_10010 [Betaproteobacteria bacterium]